MIQSLVVDHQKSCSPSVWKQHKKKRFAIWQNWYRKFFNHSISASDHYCLGTILLSVLYYVLHNWLRSLWIVVVWKWTGFAHGRITSTTEYLVHNLVMHWPNGIWRHKVCDLLPTTQALIYNKGTDLFIQRLSCNRSIYITLDWCHSGFPITIFYHSYMYSDLYQCPVKHTQNAHILKYT